METLLNNDLDSWDASKVGSCRYVAMLELTLGQRRLFMQALKLLNSMDPDHKPEEKQLSKSTPTTTKSLAKDDGLEDLLEKISREESPWKTYL